MKKIIPFIAFAFVACNGSGSGDASADTLGTRAGDTMSRNDTMYYERMTNKTGPTDSTTAPSGIRRQDTAYYERQSQKIAPDSTK